MCNAIGRTTIDHIVDNDYSIYIGDCVECPRMEVPERRAIVSLEGIEVAIAGADVNQSISDAGRGYNS